MRGKRQDPDVALRRLAQNIRRRREALGLSQEDVAGDAGISVRHYQKIESGEVDVRVTSVLSIAHALEVPIGDLTS